VSSTDEVPKDVRHDHLPGAKGYFNASALITGKTPLFASEGAFDALSLAAAGVRRFVGIFGVNGWRWEWSGQITHVVFALDADPTGQRQWRELAREAVLRGKIVGFLPPEAFGGHQDVNEAWTAGALNLNA
jgi:hypothetical protein